MGSAFGKMDPNATNSVDAQGNVVATGTPGAHTVADPNQGLTGGQLFTRKALAGTLAGAGNALQRQGGMNPAPVNFNAMGGNRASSSPQFNPQPVVPPSNQGMAPQQPQNVPGSVPVGLNGNKSPFPRGPQSLFYGAPGGF